MMKKKSDNAMSLAITARLKSETWAETIGQKVELVRRERARSRSRMFIAMCLFVFAGFVTADEILDEDNDVENMYTMVEQVTFAGFSGGISE